MLIIPAIDIRGGKCVRLFQGDYGQETIYAEDPTIIAQKWIDQGASYLHLIDLDGAREGFPRNRIPIQTIVQRSSVSVQVGGGIRDLAGIEEYLSVGVQRVIVGTAAFQDPNFLKEACQKWPGKIAVDIAAKKGKVAIAGWTLETDISAIAWAKQCEELGASVIIYTDILRDGTQKGVNVSATQKVVRALKIPLIASGGVSTLRDIEALCPLEKDGVMGVIVGKALYAGTLKLPEAIALAQTKKE
jgi:phosphoribosylformimino-5-aminoimidazole carboxamide ribotide isomerase